MLQYRILTYIRACNAYIPAAAAEALEDEAPAALLESQEPEYVDADATLDIAAEYREFDPPTSSGNLDADDSVVDRNRDRCNARSPLPWAD